MEKCIGMTQKNRDPKKVHFLKLNSPISFIKFMDFYGFTIKKKHNNNIHKKKHNIAMAQTQYTKNTQPNFTDCRIIIKYVSK